MKTLFLECFVKQSKAQLTEIQKTNNSLYPLPDCTKNNITVEMYNRAGLILLYQYLPLMSFFTHMHIYLRVIGTIQNQH